MTDRPVALVVDDHPLFRRTLRELLDASGFDVVEAGTSGEALARCQELPPTVAVIDIELPDSSGLDLAPRLTAISPRTRIVLLSGFVHDAYIDRALEMQVGGYLAKSERPEVVVEAIRSVARGQTRFSPAVLDRVVVGERGLESQDHRRSRLASLTGREREVLELVALGLSHKQIAVRLDLSVKTVQHHLSHLMDKLGIHDRVDLSRFAVREGLIEP